MPNTISKHSTVFSASVARVESYLNSGFVVNFKGNRCKVHRTAKGFGLFTKGTYIVEAKSLAGITTALWNSAGYSVV